MLKTFLRELFGIYSCNNCGGTFIKGGSPVFTGRKPNGDEIIEYCCERCFNKGFTCDEVTRALDYFQAWKGANEQEK